MANFRKKTKKKGYYNDERDNAILEEPGMDELEEYVYDSICEATDGCMVEPDGKCEHGHDSWLLYLGMI